MVKSNPHWLWQKEKGSLCLIRENNCSLDSVKNMYYIYYLASPYTLQIEIKINWLIEALTPHFVYSPNKLCVQICVISETCHIVSILLGFVVTQIEVELLVTPSSSFGQSTVQEVKIYVWSHFWLYMKEKLRKGHFRMESGWKNSESCIGHLTFLGEGGLKFFIS